VGAGSRQDHGDLPQKRQPEHALWGGCGLIAKAITSPGISIRTTFLPVLIAPKILRASEPRFDDMVRYTEWARRV
jgi:hypothetical protein